MGSVRQTPLPSVHPPHQLAQVFSDYCCGKITKIRDSLDAQAPAPPPHIVRERSFSGTSLTQFDVVTDTVHKTMLKMSPKTCDLDCIPTSLLFECTDDLLPALTNVINVSLSAGTNHYGKLDLKQSINQSINLLVLFRNV